jgi:hypothetical protein
MKFRFYLIIFIIPGLITVPAMAQHVYPVTSLVNNNVRFTAFFHLGEYIHCDFNNNIGLFSGLAVRNVGIITDEKLPQTVSTTGEDVLYMSYNIIRRQYMLGVPVALKIGSFKDHVYFFGGGEYEMAFHFKEKYWTDSYDRSGVKSKSTEWFSNATPTFLPSVFAGVQFSGGVNLKFKYYLTDFLNTSHKVGNNTQNGSTYNLSDLSRYESSQIIYFSLCWQFNTSSLWAWNQD